MQDWRDKIGGRYAISWPVYLLTAPLNIVTLLLVDPERTQVDSGIWWAVSFSTYIEFLLLLLIVDRTLFKDRHLTPVDASKVFWVGFGLGFIKGISNLLLADILGLPHSAYEVIQGGISTAISVAIAMPALAFIAATTTELKTQQQAFRQTHTSLLTQQLRNLEVLNDFKLTLSDTIKKRLAEEETISSKTLSDETASISQKLKTKVDQVRPLSHEFWERSEVRTPEFNPASLLRIFARNQTIEFWPFMVIYVATSFVTIFRFAGEESILVRLLITISITAGVFLIGKKVLNKSPRHQLLIHFLIVISAGGLSTYLPAFIYEPENISKFHGGFLIGATWIGIVSFGISFISRADQFGNEILQNVNNQIDNENLRQVALQNLQAKLNREVATYLHGQYQSQLLAIAVSIEEAEQSGDAERLQVLLHEAVELLNNPLRRLDDLVVSDFEAALAEFKKQWAGVLEVEVTHNCDGNHSPESTAAVSVLLDEAARNSFRHGFASGLQVEIECNDSQTNIQVTDNGSGLVSDIQRGIGSALFDSHCGANWSIQNRTDGQMGAVLNAQL